jgi:hypothetical protein
VTLAVSHPPWVRNLICEFIVAAIDAGSGPGKLVYTTSSGVAVATLTLSKPSFANAVNGEAIAFAIASDLDSIGGVVARASLRDSNNNEVVSCDVSTLDGNGAIKLSYLTVARTQELRCDALSYVAPE